MQQKSCDRHYDPPIQQPREPSQKPFTVPPGTPRVVPLDSDGNQCEQGKGCSWVIDPRDLPRHGGGK